MKIFKVDRLEVRVAADRAALGRAAAEAVCGAIRDVLARKEADRLKEADKGKEADRLKEVDRGREADGELAAVANVMFAAAPSQNEFLDALVEMPVDWSRVNGFHMDEYIGLDADAPQGFGNFLRGRLFEKVPFREVFFMRPRGNMRVGNMHVGNMRSCEEYAALLAQWPTDIVVLGIGENTHLAFNDPHVALFDDPEMVKVVELDEACRGQQVRDGCFGALEEVPLRAMTVTIPALMRAEYVVGVVPGKNKAEAVRRTLTEEISERHPSTILRRHPNAILFLATNSFQP